MGSPLGLTTFTNIKYTSDDGDPTTPAFAGRYNSLFNKSKFYYRPNVATTETKKIIEYPNGTKKEKITQTDSAKGSKTHQPDNSTDDLYDISTNSIINYTQNEDLPALKLNGSDFAYLRDLGVYPNNRLIVSRRFPSPVENDLTATPLAPISTVVSWIPDSQDSFFSFQTSEEWTTGSPSTDPLGDLTDIFNDIFAKGSGIDVKKEGSGVLGGLSKMLPVGGIAEALEQEVTNYLIGTNFTYDNLPQGNPNFMGEGSFRNVNSIRSEISIPIKAVYEMKFINGIDPTIAYMDILQNLLRFSSSQSVFYVAQGGGEKINEFFNKFKKGKWVEAISLIVDSIIKAVKEVVTKFGETIKKTAEDLINIVSGDSSPDTDVVGAGLSKLTQFIGSSALARYRIKFSEVIPKIMGSSSAPWHVTIGNPKNPFFSSGDMIVDGGKITMGNTLGFNDIPTRVEFDFTIRSARNLGIQEIFDKFNVGAGRQYQRSAIEFKTDFYQGSVNNTNSNDDTTNAATGAEV